MVQCRTSFSDCDTMDVSTHSGFNMTSKLLSLHEDGRPDITMLLKQKTESKQISPLLEEIFVRNVKNCYNKNELMKYTQGSTYVSFSDMIKTQLYESKSDKEIEVIKDNTELNVEL